MRAITKNTRRVTALTLAAALVVAVYLNWQYARTGIGVDEEAVNVSAVAVEGEPGWTVGGGAGGATGYRRADDGG